MSRHAAARLGVVLAALILTFAGLQASTGPILGGAPPPFSASLEGVPRAAQPAAPAPPAAPLPALASAAAGFEVRGQVVTQTFTLTGGWNAIHLEVEPFNTSPLVDPDGAGPLPAAPVSSTLEAVFSRLPCSSCLESVWTWSVPHSRMDYIIDPATGLADSGGWKRYFSAGAVGPDGVSQSFLTDLVSMHGMTGYLVRLKDGTGSVTLSVTGRPLARAMAWLPGSYNLSGFPVLPQTGMKVSTLKSTSPITDVRRLNADGRWGSSLTANDTLLPGEAYLVYYSDQTPGAAVDYTAPMNLRSVPAEGLTFTRGASGARQSITVDNLLTATASITVSLASGSAGQIVLLLTQPITKDLTTGPAVFTLPARTSALLTLQLPASRQFANGEGLLEISSKVLQTRRFVPIAAQSGSMAGLWLGEVVANDVSESRLGSTNVASGSLTIALDPRDGSAIPGAAEMKEIVTGSTSKVALTVTLALPSFKTTTPPQPVAGTTPYVGGYVFVDVNRNGQRDADEAGIGGVEVALTPVDGEMQLATTQADGSYSFQALATGTYSLRLHSATPGYTSTFGLSAPSASPSLVGRWAFDEGGGLTAFDSSGNDNHGVLTNGPAYTTSVPVVTSLVNPGSLVFDGANDDVRIAASPAFSTPQFTVAAWFNAAAWGAYYYHNTIVHMDGGNRGWILRGGQPNPGFVAFLVGTGTGWVETYRAYFSVNTWYHVAGSYDGVNMRMFINGQQLNTVAVPTYTTGAIPITIGATRSDAYHFNGMIDDVRVYDRALSAAEVATIMKIGTGANMLPEQVTVDAAGVTDIQPAAYRPQTLPAPYVLPAQDAAGNRLEPMLNFGLVPAYDASLWTGTCANRLLKQASLGVVTNGSLATTITSAALNSPPAPVTYQLLGGAQQYAVYVEKAGAAGAAGQGVACGDVVVGAPAPNAFRFRVLLRVQEDGRTSLLPTYTITGEQRVSSAAFSMPGPIAASGRFTDANPLLGFTVVVGADDPLNPFRHKYAPDHDNLDTQFNPINLSAVPPYLWESYEVRRDIGLELTQFPPGGGAAEAGELDWGGSTWGGLYREVIKGLHKNDITVKGYFVIRRVLTGSQLRPQSYDSP